MGKTLKANHVKSCGCIRAAANKINSQKSFKHGKMNTPEYSTWQAMKTRCLNPKSQYYRYYGGKGIKVCDKWLHSFLNFLSDMGEKPIPKEKYSLDRIDGNKGYFKANCRWTTWDVQNRNSRNVHWVTIGGEKLCLKDAVAKYGVVSHQTAEDRIYKLKWDDLKAILTPKKKINGKVD